MTMQADLKQLNRHIAHAVLHAKATWYADVCSKIHNMCMDPHLAWEHIRLLTKGEATHHEKKTAMAMRLPDSSRATNASENMSVFAPHFHRVYNAKQATDPTNLAQVPQCCTMWELNDPITWDEFSKAVRKLKNAKAPGLTGVPPEAFKAMSPTNLCHVYNHVNDFLWAMLTMTNGIAANVCVFPRVEIYLILIKGKVSCSWTSAPRSSAP
jgi:hypothetical protein